MAVKMNKKTKRLVLDASIRGEYRWELRRQKRDGNGYDIDVLINDQNDDGVDVMARRVYDEIVGRLDYNQVLVDAIESLGDKWNPGYVAKIIRDGLKSGMIQAEAAEVEGFIVEARDWIAKRDQGKTSSRLGSLVKKLRK